MPITASDVPLSPALRRLPEHSSGLRVPYGTYYEPTPGADLTYLEQTTDGAMMRQCSCTFGIGIPRFGAPCLHRQRNAILHRKCVTCGQRIKPGALAVLIGGERNRLPGLSELTWTSVEPPAHPACAAYSALLCPRLRQSPENTEVAVTRGPHQVWKKVVIGFGPGGHGMGHAVPLSAPVRVGGIDVYIAVPDPRQTRFTNLTQWMAREAPGQYRSLVTG